MFSFLSYYVKCYYPINSNDDIIIINSYNEIKSKILKNKIYTKDPLDKIYKFYTVNDFIIKRSQINIILNNEYERSTYVFFNHFKSVSYIVDFLNNDYIEIKKKVVLNITGYLFFLLISCISIIFSITLLENQLFNIVPIITLFLISGSTIVIIFNVIRYNAINKFICDQSKYKKDLSIDNNFIKLLVYKYIYDLGYNSISEFCYKYNIPVNLLNKE